MPDNMSAVSLTASVSDEYEILGMAGAGGMGVVYRARDRRLERTVALKFLPTELTSSEEEKQRFLREARTASSLDHPNIGVIHGIQETGDGRLFIVMAFYEGQSLAQRIHGTAMGPRAAVEIAMQMARGLGEAHGHQIVHRDIKPSNVMLTAGGTVKIVDFGLAHVISSQTATQVGAAGTIAYMSPEQAEGKATDERTDIWALGVVLAEMVTGQNPFDRGTLPGTLVAIMTEAPRGVERAPMELQRAIYRALAKDPEQRYRHCAEMLGDLEGVRERLPAGAPGASAAAGPAPAAGGGAGSAGAASTGGERRSRRPADVRRAMEQASRAQWVPAQQRRWSGWAVGAVVLALTAVVAAAGFFLARGWMSGGGGGGEMHVAVLPFSSMGAKGGDEALAEGLTDSLADRLSNLEMGGKSLWVIPTSEVRRLKITDPSEALKRLKATLAVEGSMEKNGQDVRLDLRLIDTRNLRQIGSADVEDAAGNFAALQDQAVARLAELMKAHTAGTGARGASGPVNAAAYEGYLKALGYMQRYDRPGNLDRAIEALQGAVETDPRFALGYAQLGQAYLTKSRVTKDPQWRTEAEGFAQKAAQIDGNIPDVYVTLGEVHEEEGEHQLAMQEFQRALTLDPRDARAESGLAQVYESEGRMGEAEGAFQKAAALAPDSWTGYSDLGAFYDRQGKYEQAIAADRQALELTPDNAQVYANLGGAYFDSADPALLPEGEAALRKSIALSPSYAGYANLGNVLLFEQHPAEAAEALEEAVKRNDRDYLVWNSLMLAYEWQKKDGKAAEARRHAEVLAEQRVKSHPQDAEAQSVLAYLFAEDKLKQQAMTRIEAALALAPEDAGVLCNVGEAYESMGEHARAVEYIRKALQHGYPPLALRSDPALQAMAHDPALRAPIK